MLFSVLITTLVGIFPFVFVKAEPTISNREGYAIVVFSWLAACFFGMIPYVLWGGEFNLSGAWFESVSGFTTTGATILDDVEALPPSLLFWRSCTHLLGGMGVVVFTLVVLPSMGSAQMTLSRSEVSSIARQDFKYRNKKMLRVMATSYLGLIILITGCLILANIPIFDAVNLAFSTVATGGFAVTNTSIAAYNNPAAEWILTFGMFMASLHFGLLFSLFTPRWRNVFQSPIVRIFSSVVLVATLAIFLSLLFQSDLPAATALRAAAFQVTSVISTTGYASVDTYTSFFLGRMLRFYCRRNEDRSYCYCRSNGSLHFFETTAPASYNSNPRWQVAYRRASSKKCCALYHTAYFSYNCSDRLYLCHFCTARREFYHFAFYDEQRWTCHWHYEFFWLIFLPY